MGIEHVGISQPFSVLTPLTICRTALLLSPPFTEGGLRTVIHCAAQRLSSAVHRTEKSWGGEPVGEALCSLRPTERITSCPSGAPHRRESG